MALGHPMTTLHWLSATAAMTALFWIPYGMYRPLSIGWWRHFDNPREEDEAKRPAWSHRMRRAHANATENLAPFAALVLCAHALGLHGRTLELAAATYFFARLAHFVIYAAGIPLLRTVSFGVGFAAQLVFAAAVLFGLAPA
jgi:uncharacterized MAPEG superfamily protein